MTQKQKNSKTTTVANQRVKVLYQNLGGTWYAFANINEEIFFAPINFKAVAPKTTDETATNGRKLIQHPNRDAA
ncbi:MAG: hypothetical protein ABIR96_03860 [Bdellovibrionota bacterium]